MDISMYKKRLVLLSGGLDSTTCLAKACSRAETVALTVDYGQENREELKRAEIIAKHYNVRHIVVKLDMDFNSPLTGVGVIPTDRSMDSIKNGVAPTYVPGRNTIFASIALSVAESVQADSIWLGVNAIDYSGYPDCRPEWLEVIRRLSDVCNPRGLAGNPIKIITPLIRLSKREIGELAWGLRVPIELTMSCYKPIKGEHCGKCDACKLRKIALNGEL